jgi:hypothetical protein
MNRCIFDARGEKLLLFCVIGIGFRYSTEILYLIEGFPIIAEILVLWRSHGVKDQFSFDFGHFLSLGKKRRQIWL